MRIVFFGTSEFALPSLRALMESRHELVALVTQPDRQKGRSLKVSPPPAKVVAAARGIPVLQPLDASSPESAGFLRSLAPDLFVVISFGQILRKAVLGIPRVWALNVHGSLLPSYRGAAPTNWAIINGDKKSGVTVMKMNERMDEGDIVLQKNIVIEDDDTNITLSEKLSSLGAGALIEAIDLIESGGAKPVAQDGSKATYAAKLKKEDGLIAWSQRAQDIHNRIRGLLPWPGAYTHYEGKILKVLKTEIFGRPSGDARTGEVLDVLKNKGIIVQTGQGSVAIRHLQLEGKAAMDADAFVRGHRLAKGCIFK